MKHLLFIFLFVFGQFLGLAQDEVYFQQEVNYDIAVELNDKSHFLSGFEKVTYTNNSSKTLHSIYFHLWPNAYKNYKTALCQQKLEEGDTELYHAPDSLLGYIDGLEFKVGEEILEWSYHSKWEDVCSVFLLDPLKPGETVEITTPFKVKIPKGIFSRLGHIGQSYQITQWYPKPAVFDKDGWHPMPYLDQGEFYSEFGTYDVKITLPKNYVVGATGDLVNGEAELSWLNEKAIETEKGIAAGTIPEQNKKGFVDMSFPTSSPYKKTLHFHQEKVHDFAWFADKRYHVLKGEVELPHSKRKVTTWAMFTNNEAALWKKSITYLNDATYYYSLWNGDYPYNHVTAVDGSISAGGGMEYPNITVIGESYDDFGLETVIMHEVGHNWFYGILGTNERAHPWMDEGLNSMNENRYIETKYPERKMVGDIDCDGEGKPLKIFDFCHYKYKTNYEIPYLLNYSRNKDQPIEFEAAEYSSLNYGGIVYSKTALVFDYLLAYLGEEVYDRSMQRYFNEWKFKHPGPEDLRVIFEQEAGKDLSWFFDDVIKTTKKIDYKIVRAKKDTSDESKVQLKVINKGIQGPFSISGVDKNGSILTTQWYEPIDKKGYVPFPKGDYHAYRIDAQLDIPEVKRKNNTLKTRGLCKKTEPFRLQILGSLDNPDKTQLFFTPIAGWNMNDKGMLGLAFYNNTIPVKQFEYVVAPLYAINSENLNGYASAYYHIMPNDVFQEVAIGVGTSSFSFSRRPSLQHPKGREILEYYKINPSVEFTFKKKRARQFSQLYARLENFVVFEEEQLFDNQRYTIELDDYYVNRAQFGIENKHPINPFKASVVVEQAEDFVKLNFEGNYFFAYKKQGTGLNIRFFVGSFLYNNNASARFNYALSGNSDYTYDHILLARGQHNTFLTQQAIINDGGFKNLAIAESDEGLVGSADKWIRAINLESNLFTRALSVYGDFAIVGFTTRDFANNEIDGASKPAYNLGISLNIVKDICRVYFPVVMSSEFNQLNYGEKIRFTLNINQLNPFKFARKFDL